MIKSKFQQEMVRYLVVGSINTLSGYFLIFLFRLIFLLDPYLSNALSFLTCHFMAFKMHKSYTFKMSTSGGTLWKFSLVIMFSWLVNILMLNLLLSLGLDEYLAQGLAMTCYVITSFFLHRLFTFSWVLSFQFVSHRWKAVVIKDAANHWKLPCHSRTVSAICWETYKCTSLALASNFQNKSTAITGQHRILLQSSAELRRVNI